MEVSIVQVHPSSDGHIPVVTLHILRIYYKRPIAQICKLAVLSEHDAFRVQFRVLHKISTLMCISLYLINYVYYFYCKVHFSVRISSSS